MTVRFATNRTLFLAAIFLLDATVLGISAYFASIFLPSLHRDFTIFSLVICSITAFTLLLTLQFAQPRTDAVCYFILAACWLAMGAWSTDIIGPIQCDTLRGQQTATKNGLMNAQTYCYESKVIQAFSWMIFILYSIGWIVLIALVHQAKRFGVMDIWSRPIQELGWFGEYPGYFNQGQAMPAMPQYPMMVGGTPGHTIVVQPGTNGAPMSYQTIPHGVPTQ